MPDAISFTKAAREYFGLKPGQKLTAFAAELKDLTEADKAEMVPMLADVLGKPVVLSTKAPAV